MTTIELDRLPVRDSSSELPALGALRGLGLTTPR